MQPQKPSPDEEHLPTREYVGYALGDTASNLFFQTFGIFLTYFYTDVWGIAPAAIGTMFLVVRLFDASADPLIGMMADRTQTRWGKFRPYLLWFAVPYGLGGYLLFASPELSAGGKVTYAYVTYGFMMLMYSFINVPYSSMLGVISPSPRTRTRASAFRFVGAFGGGLAVSLLVRPFVQWLGDGLDEKGKIIHELKGFQLTMAIFAVVSVVLFLISFATTKERVTPPPGQKADVGGELSELFRNFPWLMMLLAAIFSLTFIGLRNGSAIYYYKYVFGDTGKPVLFSSYDAARLAQLPDFSRLFVGAFQKLDHASIFIASGMFCQMLGSFCLSFFARIADKRILSVLLTFCTAVSYISFAFIPTDNYGLQLAANAFGSFCLGPTSALVWAMYADVADYGEWKFGRRSTGLVYAASLFAIKTGTAAAGFLLPWVLAIYGYAANMKQSDDAIQGIVLSFTLFPAAFAVLKGVMLWLYPLSKAKVNQIEADLKARRAAATPAAAQT